jgi:hypothetical protein
MFRHKLPMLCSLTRARKLPMLCFQDNAKIVKREVGEA